LDYRLWHETERGKYRCGEAYSSVLLMVFAGGRLPPIGLEHV